MKNPSHRLLPPLNEDNVIYYTPEAASLCDFALDFWRLRKRIEKVQDQILAEAYKPIAYSLDSCARNLAGQGIEIKEYTGEVYKSSLNLDVVTYESGKGIGDDALIKETVEPAIFLEEHLVRKAKVVIVTPS